MSVEITPMTPRQAGETVIRAFAGPGEVDFETIKHYGGLDKYYQGVLRAVRNWSRLDHDGMADILYNMPDTDASGGPTKKKAYIHALWEIRDK